jgi:DNA repair protein RecN (Recombination protein N)
MLTHLSIRGLAIIESLDIDFYRGFNVITGETGAGKSILIKALGMLLGGKATPEVVRKGCETASVSGTFRVTAGHRSNAVLHQLGVMPEEASGEQDVLVRRQITTKGRSQAWINDIPVTIGSLREFAESLIDIFGQHDTHRLWAVDFHLTYLDAFLSDPTLSAKYRQTYRELKNAIAALSQLIAEANQGEKDLDYLRFRLSELRDFNPTKADFERLSLQSETMRSASGVMAAGRKAMAILEGQDDDVSVSSRIKELSKALTATKYSGFHDQCQLADKILKDVEELSYGLETVTSKFDFSEDDVDRVEERLSAYQSLMRKHGSHEVGGLEAKLEDLEAKLAVIERTSDIVSSKMADIETRALEALRIGGELSKARKTAIKLIQSRVESELSELAMPGAKFVVDTKTIERHASDFVISGLDPSLHVKWSALTRTLTKLGDRGLEDAEFFMSTNSGETSLPLVKIASGGEMSRVMLALKRALTIGADTCVLVFDEIDTGISGRVADTVGKKIAELGDLCQIVCISHLPQVAAYADTHFIVEKRQNDGRTESTIRRLVGEERAVELAKLLSASSVTEASIRNAAKLLEEASSQKLQSNKSLSPKIPGVVLTRAKKGSSHVQAK